MADGRKRLSGIQYKKLRKEKEAREDFVLSKTLKIDSFFNTQSKTQANEQYNNQSLSNEKESKNNVKELPSDSDMESSSDSSDSEAQETVHNVNQETFLSKGETAVDPVDVKITTATSSSTSNKVGELEFLDCDPVNWSVNERTRDYVAKFVFCQNTNADFKKSMRQYNDGTVRYLTVNMFQRKLTNGESLPRNWLVFSESTGCVFCGVCIMFLDKNASKTKFSEGGFNEWKNASTLLSEHENSVNHRNCLKTLNERSQFKGRIDKQLVEQFQAEVNYWKSVLQRVVVVVKVLASRGMPLRGHDEKFGSSRNGNYMMLLEVIAEFCLLYTSRCV